MACTNPLFTVEGSSAITPSGESTSGIVLDDTSESLAIELEQIGFDSCPCEDVTFGVLIHWEGTYLFDGSISYSAVVV